jgi:hypothetical protein
MILVQKRHGRMTMNVQHVLERGYVVGFFDADGCVTFHKTPHGTYPRLSFDNTNYESLEKVRTILQRELGLELKIYTHVQKRAEWKDAHKIQVGSINEVESIAKFLLVNGALIKRAKIEEALEQIKSNRLKTGIIDARHWTTQEDYTLRTCWKELTDAEIGEMLGRKAGGVGARRKSLGLLRCTKGVIWTEEEDDVLRNTLHLTAKEVATMIDRSYTSIQVRRQRLELRKGIMGRPKKGVMASAEG